MLATRDASMGLDMSKKDAGRAAGGHARAESLAPAERKAISQRAAAARWDKAKEIPRAEYVGDLKIGDMAFPCSVLSDGTRILTQSDFMAGMGMYYSGWVSQNRSDDDIAADIPHFLTFKALKPFVDKHLGDLQSVTVSYRTERGNIARGIRAEIIPKICDVWLDADDARKRGERQRKIAQRAKLLMRGLAHVGIVALVDEATGYQRDRAADALAKILEAFIAKELRPWVRTFPDEFYQHLFRLRGLEFPKDAVKRPQYFGHLTNDVIYKRLAPGVLQELRKVVPKTPSGRRKHPFTRRLTDDIGHPRLREHLSGVVTVMKLSNDYDDFMDKLDRTHPRYGETLELPFDGVPSSGL
jgi:P63C domain